MPSYGADEVTARVRRQCSEIFETDVEIVPVLTGTAGNALTIAAMTPSWRSVFCHEDAHIERDELGAPEFFSGGAKLIAVPGADGKLHADELQRRFDDVAFTGMPKPSCVSLTQATEAGTVYRVDELRALCELAHARGCLVHVDGARFANALVSLDASPAELTWRAGVDALVLGATKNGAYGAEVIVLFRKELAEELRTRWHRAGHRLSKMRLLSVQLEAYFANDLWLRNARHANAMAARLAAGLREAGVEILRPVEANVVFVRLPSLAGLEEFRLYGWEIFGLDAYRLVCGFGTTEEQVDEFVAAVRATGVPGAEC